MKLDKNNVCVLIESETQLQQARELLERYGQRLNPYSFHSKFCSDKNYLRRRIDCDSWTVMNSENRALITLSELEEILKGDKDGNAEFTYNSDGSVSICFNEESEKQRDQVNEFFDPDYKENRRKLIESMENSKIGFFVVDKNGNITELK